MELANLQRDLENTSKQSVLRKLMQMVRTFISRQLGLKGEHSTIELATQIEKDLRYDQNKK